jgi:hypothetical protein
MKTKKQVIRVGDLVEVVNHRWIDRIGYNLVWTDLVEEVENDPVTHEAMKILRMWNGPTFFEAIPNHFPRDFIRAIAKHRVDERGFGGDERKIHYLESKFVNPFFDSYKCRVIGKRIAKTGTYFPPCNRRVYDPWNGDYHDPTPGGLADCKTHIILKLEYGCEIEECDVKLIERAK